MVSGFQKLLFPLFSLFALSGCAGLAGLFSGAGSSPSSTVGIEQVETSTKLAMFSPAALLDGSTSVDETIVQSQCEFRTADPPFLVPTTVANKNWTFTGRVNVDEDQSDHALGHDAQAVEYRSLFGFGWPKQQLNNWPVSMVTLSQMPKEYLDNQLTMPSDHTYPLSKTQSDALAKDYIEDTKQIQDRVQILVSAFDPSKCPTVGLK
jgi:hypothetical protein